jgi:hypothetical protein
MSGKSPYLELTVAVIEVVSEKLPASCCLSWHPLQPLGYKALHANVQDYPDSNLSCRALTLSSRVGHRDRTVRFFEG